MKKEQAKIHYDEKGRTQRKRILSSLMLTIFLSTSICTRVSAMENAMKEDNGSGSANFIQKNILGMQAKKRDKYPMSYLKTLSNKELADVLATINWYDIPDLFKYNADSCEFYSDENRVQAIIDALSERGSQYTESDNKGIPTLVEVLRSGFYLGFYNNELKYLNERSFHDKCIPAMLAIENNKNFKLGTRQQDEVVASLGKLIGNASCNVQVVNGTVDVLKQYNQNISSYAKESSKGNAIYEIIKEVEYDMSNFARGKSPKDTPWHGKIDSFIDEVEKLALIGSVDDNNAWLVNNGIYYTGKLGEYHSDPKKSQETLSKALTTYPCLSEQYFNVVQQLVDKHGGKTSDGKTVDMSKLKEEGKNHYLPKTYTFDDGKFIFKTGDKVSVEKVKRLYWAAKEVNSQFYRVIGSDKPVDKGHADDVLTVVIYNSPKEYKINSLLNGFSTDNGGIYIESIGTFFTYERTPQESIYTLEELFRHEFTHYLQGRYLVPGLWGQGELYKNDRLTWYEEGTAEFFAGSTRSSGVLPRRSVASGINSNSSQRYSVNDILHAKYGTWEFYNYGFAMADFMYNNNLDMFDKINNSIKTNDASGYDAQMNTMSKDEEVNKAYQGHMQSLVDKHDSLTVPLVADAYLDECPNKPISEISSEITSAAGLQNVQTSEEKSQFFNTFTIRGTYVGNASKGKIEDWKDMNETANKFLKTLETYPWTGYKTTTCYFTNYKVDSANRFQFDVVFQGKLSGSTASEAGKKDVKDEGKKDVKDASEKDVKDEGNPFDKAKGPILDDVSISGKMNENDRNDIYYFDVTSPGKIDINVKNNDKMPINWLLYSESDKKNYVTYAKADGNNLKDSYIAKPGRYYLHIYKYENAKGSYSINVKGAIGKKNDLDANDKGNKDNNSFDKALAITTSGGNVSAKMSMDDWKDIYCFEVDSPQDIDININNSEKLPINWLLYSESDLKNYLTYANADGTNLKGSFKAKPGKYYLYVYKHAEGAGTYTVKVNTKK